MTEQQNVKLKPDTLVIQSGLNTDEQYSAVVPPLYLASNYRFADIDSPPQYDYSRSGNPSRDVLASTLTELEQGAGAVITSSGMSAINLALQLLAPGDVLIAPNDCYGGSHRLFNSLAERGQFELHYVDFNDANFEKELIRLQPTMIWLESPSNPLLRVTDIKKVAEIAKIVNSKLVVDNTFMSPLGQNPIALGADIVVHSCTKYINGHSDVVAGAIICRDVETHERLSWWGNNIGVTGSPFDSYLILRGLRSLPLRLKQHSENALALAELLQSHPLIKAVHYPGLASHPDHQLAKQQHRYQSGMLSFEFNGDKQQVKAFIKQLKLFTLAESLGGVESLVCHPASMTHAAMSEEAQRQAGITEQLIRFSVGIEDKSDLIADVLQALAIIQNGKGEEQQTVANNSELPSSELDSQITCRLNPAFAALW